MTVLTSAFTLSGVRAGCSVRTRSPWTRSIGGSPELRCRSEAPFSAASRSSASMVGIRLVLPAFGTALWCKTRARARSGCAGLVRGWSGVRVTLSVQFPSTEGGLPPAEDQGGAARHPDGHQRVDHAEDDVPHPRLAFPVHRERDQVDDHVRGVGVGHRQREATQPPDAERVDEQVDAEERPEYRVGRTARAVAEEDEAGVLRPAQLEGLQQVRDREHPEEDRERGERGAAATPSTPPTRSPKRWATMSASRSEPSIARSARLPATGSHAPRRRRLRPNWRPPSTPIAPKTAVDAPTAL